MHIAVLFFISNKSSKMTTICMQNWCFVEQSNMKTKSGAEPKLVVLVNADDDPVSIFIVADAMTLCEVPNADVVFTSGVTKVADKIVSYHMHLLQTFLAVRSEC